MKRTLLGVVVVAILAIAPASTLSAQGIRWGVNAGVLMPMGDYNKADKPGWIVAAGATNWLPGGMLGIRGDLSYGQTKHDSAGGSTKIVGGMASLVYGLGSSSASMRPFVTGGMRIVIATRFTSIGTSGFSTTFLPITVGLTFGK